MAQRKWTQGAIHGGRMTPLVRVRAAELFFAEGGQVYHFTVPKHVNMENHVSRIRAHALVRRYSWKVARNFDRNWIIKIKICR